MQGYNIQRLQRSIAIKNDPAYIKTKLAIKFLFLFVIGIFAGGAFFYSGHVDRNSIDIQQIKSHFDSIFVGSETLFDHLLTVLTCSEKQIRLILLVFISGFTYFSFIVSGCAVILKGFLLGFTTSALMLFQRRYPDVVTSRHLLGFMALEIVVAFILICISTAAYIFSFDLRMIKRNRSILKNSPEIYDYAFAFVLALGGILISSYLYCVFFAFSG